MKNKDKYVLGILNNNMSVCKKCGTKAVMFNFGNKYYVRCERVVCNTHIPWVANEKDATNLWNKKMN